MSLSKASVRRPVTTVMVLLIVVAFGIMSITNLQMDMMPNMNIPIAIVMTTYSGTGPQEMETLITKPMEEALSSVSGIEEMTSTSSYGSSFIMIQFEDDVDIDMAALDMREQVDLYKGTLPDGANDPMVMKLDISSMTGGIYIGVTDNSGDLVELKRRIEDRVSNRLERQDGVASVTLNGGKETEISVVLNEEKMRGYGVSESQISGLLASENLIVPTGSIKQGDKRLQLRVDGEFASLEDMRSLPITSSTGAVIYLRDLAEISEVYKEDEAHIYLNGKPGALLIVQKQSTANTVNVSQKVNAELEKLRLEMPDMEFSVVMDPAEYTQSAINSVVESAMYGGIFAVIILYVFLRSYRSTVIVAISMPVSIIATFILMYYSGITLNIVSLGGLTLGIGMLVDNSIVVLESIYRKIEAGEESKAAAIEGAREVAMSVVASTLTTVAVFLPISFSGGMAAQIFNEMSMTIAFSLGSSLVVALTFVPMAASLLLKPEHVSGTHHKSSNILVKLLDKVGAAIEGLTKGYTKVLAACLRRKKRTVFVAMLFTVLSFASLAVIGFEFMAQSDEGMVTITITMPEGSLLEETDAITTKVLERVQDNPEIAEFAVMVGGSTGMGGGGTDSSTIMLTMAELTEREKSSSEYALEYEKAFKDIAGAEIEVSASSMSMGSYGSDGTVSFILKGDDFDTLSEVSNDLNKQIEDMDGVWKSETSLDSSSPQASIKVNRMKATSYGVTASSIASIVRTAVDGSVATTYKIDGDEYDIRIRQEESKVDYLNDLENILIPSATGASIPLYELADIEIVDMPVSITRTDNMQYVTITATLDSGFDSGTLSRNLTAFMNGYILPEGYMWEFSGTTQSMNETFSSLLLALVVAVFLVYAIMAAQFESLLYPFIVMFSIPIALGGGICGLLIMGERLSIVGMLGLIMLAGVVVNNAIVLVDYTNLLIRERGMSVIDALQEAGPVRLRPILMTTLTTVLALVPMMVSSSEGSEMMRGLAIVVVFGLSLSTLITLLFIPVVYAGFNQIKDGLNAKRARSRAKKSGLSVN